MGAMILTLMFRKFSGNVPELFREMILFLTLVPERKCSGNFPVMFREMLLFRKGLFRERSLILTMCLIKDKIVIILVCVLFRYYCMVAELWKWRESFDPTLRSSVRLLRQMKAVSLALRPDDGPDWYVCKMGAQQKKKKSRHHARCHSSTKKNLIQYRVADGSKWGSSALPPEDGIVVVSNPLTSFIQRCEDIESWSQTRATTTLTMSGLLSVVVVVVVTWA